MNLLEKRRQVGAICDKCQCPAYKMTPPNEDHWKPLFECLQCSHSWMYGEDGGIYAQYASTEKTKTKCALPGCTNNLPIYHDMQQKFCCKSHGKKNKKKINFKPKMMSGYRYDHESEKD